MKIERNAPCRCGSGKKFKRCHFLIDHEKDRQANIAWRERMAREAAEERQARDGRLESYQRPQRSRRLGIASLLGMIAAVAPASAVREENEWQPTVWRCCLACHQQHFGGLHRTLDGDRCANVDESDEQ